MQTRFLAIWTLGLALSMASWGSMAQGVEALEWQPSQSMMPTVISTPHNDVRKLLRQAKYPDALLLVNKNLATNPRDPQMRFWLGFLYEQLGQPDMAMQVYLGLTQEYPELAEPHNNLGVLYASKGNYLSAKASLDTALRANPSYATAHENMGDLLVNMARQSYERALALEPKRREANAKIQGLKPVLDMTQGKP
jgi:tetratricopeptide (TPR) repeat protein